MTQFKIYTFVSVRPMLTLRLRRLTVSKSKEFTNEKKKVFIDFYSILSEFIAEKFA